MVVPPTSKYGSVSVPHASAAPSVMLVAGKRTGEGREKGEESCHPEVKRSMMQVGLWSHLGSQSEASHHWGISVSMAVHFLLPSKRPSYLSTQPSWTYFPSKARLSVVQQGNSTGKNSPWASTVCSSPNSLIMRRHLEGQRQPLRTVPDTRFQIVSQALSQIFPDQHFLGLNQWCEPLHACFTPSMGSSQCLLHSIQPKAPGRPESRSLGKLLQVTHDPSLPGNLLPAVQGTTPTLKWPLI